MTVFCSAKVNLGWTVGDRRPDGYHDVEGLIHTISLADRLEITAAQGGGLGDHTTAIGGADVVLRVDGPYADPSLLSSDNLVLKAAELVAARADPRPVLLTLHKEVPVGAGLGGGSADAAGALMGLSLAWGASLTAGQLVALAAELGSDVPAILLGGLVHASGRGDRVRAVGALDGLGLVLGLSPGGLRTAAVYARLDELRRERDPSPSGCFPNDLQEAAVDLDPSLSDALQAMSDAGSLASFVSGSGPTVVGVCPRDRAAEVAERAGPAFDRVVLASTREWGIRTRLARS